MILQLDLALERCVNLEKSVVLDTDAVLEKIASSEPTANSEEIAVSIVETISENCAGLDLTANLGTGVNSERKMSLVGGIPLECVVNVNSVNLKKYIPFQVLAEQAVPLTSIICAVVRFMFGADASQERLPNGRRK